MSTSEQRDQCQHRKMPDIKKAKKKIDRLLLGVVIGGAVGSIMGIGWHSKQGKKIRRQANEKRRETWEKISNIIDEQKNEAEEKNANSIWHFLHHLFIGKNKK
jgi:gas vesicle protein